MKGQRKIQKGQATITIGRTPHLYLSAQFVRDHELYGTRSLRLEYNPKEHALGVTFSKAKSDFRSFAVSMMDTPSMRLGGGNSMITSFVKRWEIDLKRVNGRYVPERMRGGRYIIRLRTR